MKQKNNTTLRLLFTGLVLLVLNGHSQNTITTTQTYRDSLTCLEISGELSKQYKSNTGSYKVVLVHLNTPIDSSIVKNNKSFQFKLVKNTYYAIKIYKKGYADKLISICTALPAEVFTDKLLRFHFKADLISLNEFERLNSDSKDFPIAIISFNQSKKIFNYNEKYTRNIRKSLYSTKNPLLF